MNKLLQKFIQDKQLPKHYLLDVNQWFIPLAAKIAHWCRERPSPLVLGIQGAQGTGKSTLAALLSLLLREKYQLNVANLSLDDFYLTRSERHHLSKAVHPLLRVRGVPGTHDLTLLKNTFDALRKHDSGACIALPRFDKAVDERVDPMLWALIDAPVDVIIFEGWCLCVPPEEEAALKMPLNDLEKNEDPDGRWRRYVNARLKEDYPLIFNQMDTLVVLQAPAFASVYDWRLLQEEKLKTKHGAQSGRVMCPSEVKRFLLYFERLTRHAMAVLPKRADVVYEVHRDHRYQLLKA